MTAHISNKTIRAACRRGAFGSGETLYMQSGSTLAVESGATLTIADGADFNVGDTATPTWADGAELWFGTGNDADFVFDGTDFLLNAAAASTEFKIEKDFIVKLGAQASVVGSGVPLSATDTAALQIYSDDGNASISSAVHTAAGRFRNLQVYTGGNREQEADGVRGQLVSIAGTNRHNMCGVLGSYEAATSLVVDGQAWTTDPWIQAGVMGRIGVGSGITTINANGILAGLAAMSATASFAANSGVYAGLYVGSWSGSIDWGYGIYIQGGAVNRAFQAGESSAVYGSGVKLDATYTQAMAVFSDDGGASIGSGTLTAAARFRNLQTYTTGNREQEACGVRAQLVSVAGVNRHNMAALWGSYEVQTSLTVDGQIFTTDPWIQAAVLGRIGAGSALTTINTYGRLCGVAAMSATASLAANSGVYTAFYAGHWGGTSGSMDWEYALYAEGCAHGAYLDIDAGAVTGEEHAFDIVNTGTLSSGDSLVGANIVTTCAGSAGSWVSGLYVKALQASKMVNGYICGAEIELQSTAAGASDNAVLVLNSTRNHTGSPPACDPYIMFREYGTTYANALFRIFGDTGQGATNSVNAALLVSQAKAAHEADCDVVIRCMFGSTPIWLLATTVAPS
jgi:hypothetical protein